jgi:hypothetical protein
MTTNTTTVSQDLKDFQDRFLPQSGLDLLLKYSALFIAGAYLSGFAYFASLLGFLHTGRSPMIYPISTAIVLTEGTIYLGVYLIFLACMLYPILSKRWWLCACLISCAAICWTTTMHFGFGTNWSLTVTSFLTLLVPVFMVWRYHHSPTGLRYYLAVAYVVFGLIAFSSIQGFQRTRGHQQVHKVRLLVSPDAKAGAKDLGIEFSLQQRAGTEPELSAPLTILIDDDKTYLLRTDDGKVLELAKDKVWGAQWERY